MGQVGMAMLEGAGADGDGFVDLVCDQHRADRLVAAAQPFGHRHDVGGDALLLARMQRAGEIGRASCRARVCQSVLISVGAVSLTQKEILLSCRTLLSGKNM